MNLSPEKFVFMGCCVNLPGPRIRAMVEDAKEVSRKVFMLHCPSAREKFRELGYEDDPRKGLTAKNDWHISYHRSRYAGKRCYYFRWSAIEYVFVRQTAYTKDDARRSDNKNSAASYDAARTSDYASRQTE